MDILNDIKSEEHSPILSDKELDKFINLLHEKIKELECCKCKIFHRENGVYPDKNICNVQNVEIYFA